MTLKSLACGMAILIGPAGSAVASDTHEIRVTLFGQPCTLQGPASEAVLKSIHAISPEQLYPTFEPGEKSSTLKAALEKLRAATNAPSGLDSYREQIGKRLEAETAFLAGLEESQRVKKAEPLLSKTKPFFSESRLKPFEATARKLEGNPTPAQKKEILEQLFAAFTETLPNDPEEEFHKAIHRMKVQYVCSFEGESGDDSGDGE